MLSRCDFIVILCDFFVISREVYEKKSVICPSERPLLNDFDSTFEELLHRNEEVTIHVENLQKLMLEVYKCTTSGNPSFLWESFNRPFSYSGKEPGSSVIFIHFYTRGSIEWR